jgi:hypothetical protein
MLFSYSQVMGQVSGCVSTSTSVTAPACGGTSTISSSAAGGKQYYTVPVVSGGYYTFAITTGSSTCGTYAVSPSSVTASGTTTIVSVEAGGSCCWASGGTSATLTYTRPGVACSISGGTSPICSGSSSGTLTASGSGGNSSATYTYEWYNSSGTALASGATYTPSNTTTTTYYAIATNSGCTGQSGNITITVVQPPTGTGSIATDNYCSSVGSGSVSVTGISGASQYAWSLQSGLSGSSTTSSISFTGSTAGTYGVSVTPQEVASGITCSASQVTGTVHIVQTPTGTGSIATDNYCSSVGAGSVSVTGISSATQYAWSLQSGLTGSSTTSSISFTGSTGGTYGVSVTPQDVADGITCSASQVTGTVNIVQNASGGSISPTGYCASTGSGTVTVSGATNASQYLWALPSGLTGSSTSANITVSGSSYGNYTVSVTPQNVADGITCAASQVTGAVTISQAIDISGVNTSSLCQGQTVNVQATNPTSAGVTASCGSCLSGYTFTAPTPSGTSATYNINYTNGSCTNSVTLLVYSQGSITSSNATMCAGGTRILVGSPSGGSFTVSPTCSTCIGGSSSGPSGSTFTAPTVTAGTQVPYVFTYTIGGGGSPCTAPTQTIDIDGPSSAPTGATATPATICPGGSTTLSYSGGALLTGSTAQWYSGSCGGTSVGSGNPTVSGITSPTNYYVQFVDGAPCSASTSCASTSVALYPQASSVALSNEIDPCNGGNDVVVTITGGTSPYNYTLSPIGTETAVAAVDSFNAAGATSVTISAITDGNGCAPASGAISGSPLTVPTPTLTGGGTNMPCNVPAGYTRIFYDASGNLMGQVTAQVRGIGLGITDFYTDALDGTPQATGAPLTQHYLQRHFHIEPDTSGVATVCLFILNAEASALNTASASDNSTYFPQFASNLSNAAITKYHAASMANETPATYNAGADTSHIVIPTSALTITASPTINGTTYSNATEICFNVTSFSGFYIGSQNPNDNPLPVTLVFLNASAENDTYIELQWATASETDNSGFEVQRSTDGNTFEDLYFVQGHLNSTTLETYSYDDYKAVAGVTYYYRLKQSDVDGNSTYSDIVSAALQGSTGFALTGLVPNPANTSVSLNILSNIATTATVVMTDMLGRVVANEEVPLAVGYNTSQIDLSKVAEGTYNVTLYSGNINSSKRLVVIK